MRFGTDGVRGLANEELTPEFVLALGRAIARTVGNDQPFLVGRDTRCSGPMIEAALTAGLCAEGVDVESAGPIPTPGLASLARERDVPAAMVTASHNPFSDNGIKVFGRGGRKLDANDEAAIEAELQASLTGGVIPNVPIGRAVGSATRIAGAVNRYVVQLTEQVDARFDGLHVVLDCANGATYGVAPRVFQDLGAEVTVLNAQPNGVNINDRCGATEPAGLVAEVRASGAAAGFAFDGDGDRVIAVDEHGEIVDGDALLGMHAIDLAGRGALVGDAIAVTVMSNLGLRRALRDRSIAIVETPVGDRHVLDALDAEGLVLGGEQSGHLIFRAIAPTGDGTLAALLTLDLLVRTGAPLSELAAPFARVPQELRAVPVRDASRLAGATSVWSVVDAVAERLGNDGRVLVRASGTEPVVRIMVEHLDPRTAQSATDELVAAVEAALT